MKKKLIFSAFLLLLSLQALCLTRYLVAGGTGNWNSTTNWSASDGGASGASFPVAGDDVFITSPGSGAANITVNVSSACATITVENGWTGTWTETNTITTTGNVTWGSGMTFAGTGSWSWNGTPATITSNGKVFTGSLSITGANMTITLADDCIIAGNILHTGTGGTLTVNNNNLKFRGNITATAGRVFSGTTTIEANGNSGTSTISVSGTITCNFKINSTNAISIGTFNYNTGTFTYTTATSVTCTAVATFGASTTITSNGMTWAAVTFSGASQTFTLGNDMDVNGTLSFGSSGSPVLNGNTLKVGGSWSNTTTSSWSGTTAILIDGTGTWSSVSTACTTTNNVTINTAGTLTLGSIMSYGGGTLTYTAGSIVNTGSTMTLVSSCTMNTAPMIWGGITVNTSATITINSLLSISGTLNTGILNVTFTGTSGWTAGTFTFTTGDDVLKSGNTYTVTSSFTVTGTAANNGSLTSSSGGSDAIFTLQQGATQDVGFCSATDMDSGNGQTVWSYKPTTLSSNINWNTLPVQPITITTAH